jgi:hypothetical protein
VPTTRVKPTTVSHDLPQVQPRAQQGTPPRPTPGLGLSLGLGRRSLPRPTLCLGLSLGLGRSHNLAQPQPRPQEKSPPRPTPASDRLRYRGYIVTLPLASHPLLRRNKIGVTSNYSDSRTPGSTVSYASTRLKRFSDGHVSTCTGLKTLLRQPR